MRIRIAVLFGAIACIAVLAQYYLMLENRLASVFETTIRFLGYFTILTNLLIALYFTLIVWKIKNGILSVVNKPGTLTAITVYITTVGLVYQIVLRHTWQPEGLQMVVDELLHTVIPVLVIIYWYLYEDKSPVTYRQIPQWLIYPVIYVICILINGNYSDFYPYPFVDAGKLGLSKVIINIFVLMTLFVLLSAIFIRVGRIVKDTRHPAGGNLEGKRITLDLRPV